MSRPIVVRVDWDEEAGVWVATSPDVAGLVTEADTLEAVRAKVRVMIPELLDLAEGDEINLPIELVAYATEVVRVA